MKSMRIRNTGSGFWSFIQWLPRFQQKIFLTVFAYYLLQLHFISLQKLHKTKEIKVFLTFLLVDGRIRIPFQSRIWTLIRTNNYGSWSWRPKSLGTESGTVVQPLGELYLLHDSYGIHEWFITVQLNVLFECFTFSLLWRSSCEFP